MESLTYQRICIGFPKVREFINSLIEHGVDINYVFVSAFFYSNNTIIVSPKNFFKETYTRVAAVIKNYDEKDFIDSLKYYHMENELVLFTEYSSAWQREMEVRLIAYDNGSYDLHCQTGDHHKKAIEKATELLEKRGMLVGKAETIGGTGIYYPVHFK